ncbi:pps1 dual specificity phosphatase [Xylona heveae TC161]|uniref:Pps1 dual specificity phosphatase n=1 Tax=Xylona heveae (strain CBS 132557 / TC161) TaxID=1328760 RepID=A0A164ZQX5_XYLHT|nr:pps1 dual specificity phosphatase [Xylona heveae TC161]KZF19395.1 pps1 dual specificity phosphatase [Xylona heveae TC161]
MAAAVVRPVPFRQSPTPPPVATPAISLNTSSPIDVPPVPNKHIPICPPGLSPAQTPATPPASPPTGHLSFQTSSVLHPPDVFPRLSQSPLVYALDAANFAAAFDHISTQPLPDPNLVFPWLHGLHAENNIQLSFFMARRKAMRRTPPYLRAITVVKAGGDLTRARIKAALSPEEILPARDTEVSVFPDVDPKFGFSVRNFQIQAAKMATVSDIVIYGDENTSPEEVKRLACRISEAQHACKIRLDPTGTEFPMYSTFVLTDSFHEIEKKFPDLVAIDSQGCMNENVMDFFYWERREMCTMSQASEISRNVWLGPTPDSSLCPNKMPDSDFPFFDILIEASDSAQAPNSRTLQGVIDRLEQTGEPQHLLFPSSGSIMPPTWSHAEVDSIVETCRWIYDLAYPGEAQHDFKKDSDGDTIMEMHDLRPRRILIHCTDGYTESSLLALAYFMYAEGLPVHEAWLQLHREKGRNFFAYSSDVSLLSTIQPRLLQESPRWKADPRAFQEPAWLSRMDGSLPNRILPYMYLGNLGHANNPELLWKLGIRRVLSVGEPVSWPKEEIEKWGKENLLLVERVQDNGVDPLTEEFDRCLEFIGKGKRDGTATLVHCRVGVSRSATICIAEVMNHTGMSFPRAYCFVRARRLNVIIQPHLRFSYELLKWEEYQQLKRKLPVRREHEWATIAREIALLNKPYSR